MSRPLRLEYPGAVWHVMNRGVERRDIFKDAIDRHHFLSILAEAVSRFRWIVHALVLMTNHFHLLIETPVPALSRGMQKLEGGYAEFFNVRNRRAGHLFQGRFKAHLVEKESYLLTVARYIVLNPVRAKMVPRVEDWPWSSYRATAGLAPVDPWLTVGTILDSFDPADSTRAALEYRRFVAEGLTAGSPWDNLVAQTYLGGVSFLKEVQRKLSARELSPEHRFDQRNVTTATLDDVWDSVLATFGSAAMVKSRDRRARLAFALLAHEEALARLAAIGDVLGVRASGARYLIDRAVELEKSEEKFSEQVKKCRVTIRNCKL